MSSLTSSEKRKLERLLDMKSGYVDNFSDRTFGEFFDEILGIDIHDQRYQLNGTSKANKLRTFWKIESDHYAGISVEQLVRYVEENSPETGLEPETVELIAQCKEISQRLLSGKVTLEHLKKTADVFDAKYMAEQIKRMEQSIEADPALAIGTAKELIETCCKTILGERGKQVSGSPDIPTLTKETLKELRLVPEGVPDEKRGSDVIKRLLQNLGTIGNNLAELRGLYGTGHGKHGKSEGLNQRHARLAVGAAVTFSTFLFDTHKEIG